MEKNIKKKESQPNKFNVNWDYTQHATHYDKRADYSEKAIDKLVEITACSPMKLVADIGAGTGKLSKELLKRGLTIKCVEPNEAMSFYGMQRTQNQSVEWSLGTGEDTGLQTSSIYAAFFGSSFNVVNQAATLDEVCRVLVPNGWFGCMWNHRDLNDPIQKYIENIIRSDINEYAYGLRRENPTAVIEASGNFSNIKTIEERFFWNMTRDEIIIAWKSHATLRRQAGSSEKFDEIISKIDFYLATLKEPIAIPYTTRIYFAQMIKDRSDF